jgi:hypothetical protein
MGCDHGGTGLLPLDVSHPLTAGGWANCTSSQDFVPAICHGALGLNMDGLTCAPPPAVCCIGHECELTSAADCADQGGVFHAEWVSCEPNPCKGISPVRRATWGQIKSALR